MSKFKLSVFIGVVCLIVTVVLGIVEVSHSSQPSVQLTTNPSVTKIFPFEAETTTPQFPVELSFRAVDGVGQPLKNAKFKLTILTPPKNPWLTTDFPIVEGTKLLEMEAIVPHDELQIQQMLPIRGTYQFLVNVIPTIDNTFTPIQQRLTLSVPENSLKYRNFLILATILLITGLLGGWVIGGKQFLQQGEIVSKKVQLLFTVVIIIAIAVLLFVNIKAEIAQSEMSMSHVNNSVSSVNNSGILQSQGLEVQLLGDIHATVGKPASLAVKVINTLTNKPKTDVILNIKTTQLENNWIAFTYSGIPDATGQLLWQQQFFDGTPHQVTVDVSPKPNAEEQFEPFQVQRKIEVEGVTPPLFVRLVVFTYFTGIVIIGFVLGLRLGNNQTKIKKYL